MTNEQERTEINDERMRIVKYMAYRMKFENENEDELVNECIVFRDGYILTCPIKQVMYQCRFAILGYHARISGRPSDSCVSEKSKVLREKAMNPSMHGDMDIFGSESAHEETADNKEFCEKYLKKLKKPLQNVLNGIYYRQRTLQQLADQEGVSKSAMSLRKKEALKQIRNLIEKDRESY